VLEIAATKDTAVFEAGATRSSFRAGVNIFSYFRSTCFNVVVNHVNQRKTFKEILKNILLL